MRRFQKSALSSAVLAASVLTASAAQAATWNSTTGGNWSDTSAAGWNGAYPNAVGATATISTAITAAQIINLDVSPSVGALTLGSSSSPNNAWTIQDTNNLGTSLTIQASGSDAVILTSRGSPTNTISVPMILNSAMTLYGNGVISGNISGGNSVTLTANTTSSWLFSGVNTYTGSTIISAGTGVGDTLQFAKEASLYDDNSTSNNVIGTWTAATVPLFVHGGATAAFNVGGAGEFTPSDIAKLTSLAGTSHGFYNGSFLGLDTTNAGTSGFTYSNAIVNPRTGLNVLGLTKLGTNTLSLTGNNTYTGATTITGGTLSIGSGGALGDTNVTASSGTTFQAFAGTSLGTSGGGAASLTASSGSTLTFTDSGTPSTFTLNGAATGNALNLASAILNFNVGGASTAADELLVTGGSTANVTNTDGMNIIYISVAAGTTSLTPGTYTLIDDSGGGLIAADFVLGNDTITVGSMTYDLSLGNVDSMDEVLNISLPGSSVPEPASLSLLALGAIGILRRRRRVV